MASSTKASTPTKSSSKTQLLQSTQEEIRPKEEKTRLLAYEKWEQAGSPCGEESKFWYEAENELIEAEDFE